MPKAAPNYDTLITTRLRAHVTDQLVGVLRQGTDLSMTLGQFVTAVKQDREILSALGNIAIGDVFSGIQGSKKRAKKQATKTRRAARAKAKGSKKRGRKKASVKGKRGATKKKTAKRGSATRTAGKKARTRAAPKRARADAKTIEKRLNAIVAVLEGNGEWMKTGSIFAALTKQKPLFNGVQTNLVSQYLARLVNARPPRAMKKGERSLSEYRMVSPPAAQEAREAVVVAAKPIPEPMSDPEPEPEPEPKPEPDHGAQ